LPSHLEEAHGGIKADLEKLIVFGGSAGGHLALLSGLGLASKGVIKAVVAAYPSVEPRVGKPEKAVLGAPTIPKSVLDDFLANMEPGKIVTSAFPPERMNIALSITQQGRKAEFIGSEDGWWPMRVLEESKEMPFTFIMHGQDDSAVHVEGSVKFAEFAKEKFGEGWGLLILQPGEHGFDDVATLEMEWLKNALKKVTEIWLGERV
jgi:acetyl esterase/lipase